MRIKTQKVSFMTEQTKKSVFCFTLVNPFLEMPRLSRRRFVRMNVSMLLAFSCSADISCSKALGDRASRYLWSLEHLKGAKSGKAGEKGFKPGGGDGCCLQKGICLWSKGRQKWESHGKKDREVPMTHPCLFTCFAWGQLKNKWVRRAFHACHSITPFPRSRTQKSY